MDGCAPIDMGPPAPFLRAMTRVLIHTSAPQRHIARLTEAFPTVEIEGVADNAQLAGRLDSFAPTALLTVNMSAGGPYPRQDILNCPSLRWVAVAGSGTDHLAPWDPEKLTVTNAAGISADVMAEFVLGGCLHFSMDVPGLQADQAERRWDAGRMVRPLGGQTLLIIGLGRTGLTLAQRAKSFGMTVIGTRATPRATPGCDEVHGPESLPQLLPRADFIAVCTPRVPSTIGLLSAASFALMKPCAVLVNVARGGVVDETALCTALETGQIRGALFDVFAQEPLPEGSPLWSAPNLLIAPHCSGVYEGWETAAFDVFLDNLGRFLQDAPLHNVVDPARGY